MNYQWILTLQWATPAGARTATRVGTWTASPGDTRSSISGKIIGQVKETEGIQGAVVLFFSLEPDDLGG